MTINGINIKKNKNVRVTNPKEHHNLHNLEKKAVVKNSMLIMKYHQKHLTVLFMMI